MVISLYSRDNTPRGLLLLIGICHMHAPVCPDAGGPIGSSEMPKTTSAVPVSEQPEWGPWGVVAERSPASYFFSRDASMASDGSGVALGPPKMHDIRIKHLLLTLRDASYRQPEPIMW